MVLLTALSPDGALVAAVQSSSTTLLPSSGSGSSLQNDRLRLLIFSVATGNLQATLVQQKQKQSVPEGVSEDGTENGDSSKLKKLVFVGNKTVVGLLSSGRGVAIWDLSRGVQVHALQPKKKEQHYLDLVAALAPSGSSGGDHLTSPKLFYLLVSTASSPTKSKLQIHEYDASTGKLQRKIKAGKCAAAVGGGASSAASLNLTEKLFVVRYDKNVAVLNIETGEKVSKNRDLNEASASPSVTSSCVASFDLACTTHNGSAVGVHLPTGTLINDWGIRLDGDDSINSNAAAPLQLVGVDDGDSFLLLAGLALHRITKPSDKADVNIFKAEPVSKLLVGDSKVEYCSVHLPCQQGALKSSTQLVALLKHRVSAQFQVQTITLPALDISTLGREDGVVAVKWREEEGSRKRKTDNNRTSSTINSKTAVLGPAHAGGEARTVSEFGQQKRAKTAQPNEDGDINMEDNAEGELEKKYNSDEEDDDDEGPTIAERLEKLRQAMDEAEEEDDDDDHGTEGNRSVGFAVNQATTESLTKFLKQALQSADKAMLELALETRDTKMIRETVQNLDDDQLPLFLTVITSRLASKPARADALCPWLSAILRTNRIRSLKHLQPLQNLIEERMQVFPALLQLDGRLSMMGN